MAQKHRDSVYGYVRSNYTEDIPDELILLFVQWYYDGVVTIIKGDLMKEFLSIAKEKELSEK